MTTYTIKYIIRMQLLLSICKPCLNIHVLRTYVFYIFIHCTMAGSTIIMMPIQTLMLSIRSPILTRLIVTEPSLSLTVLEPMSNCMVTIGATVAVNGEENNVCTLNHQIASVKMKTINKCIFIVTSN